MRIIILLNLLITSSVCFSQRTNIELSLFELPDVIFKPIEVPKGYLSSYEIRVKQPLDHSNPDKGFFYQRVYLSHKSIDRPMVIVTEGYSQSSNRVSELAELLDANQLIVEHRYFGQSVPEKMNYTYLNLQQVSADLHKINTLFKQIYNDKWISTGISKGGQTTIYYRYFYPEDVDVSVPYVAPFSLEFEDKRIYEFLDTIGSEECRNKIRAFQYKLFENREEVIEHLRWYSFGAGLSFGYTGLEAAFEYAILEYPFMFWQWGTKCEDIPGASSSIEEALIHLLSVSNIDFYSDDDMEEYGSHYYQAATEMGYYGYETEPFKDYLQALPINPHPHAAFVPNRMYVEYDNTLSKEVFKWLTENGDQFVYIYGGRDTWTATAVPKNDKRDAVWIVLPGKDHGQARIKNMTQEEQKVLIEALEKWLGRKIDTDIPISWLK